MRKFKLKLTAITLIMAVSMSLLCSFPVQASAIEEVVMPQASTETVFPITVRLDQQTVLDMAQKRAEEEARAAAEAAAQEAARKTAEEEAAKKAAEEAAKKEASKKKSSSNSKSAKGSKGTKSPKSSNAAQTAVNAAKSMIGTRYGATINGTTFDCSGLVYYAYKQAGISLPHSSSAQAQYCKEISKGELQPGDLVFWEYSWGSGFMNIGHVGIYVGNGQVIDASPSGVVQRSLYDQGSICFYGRPC